MLGLVFVTASNLFAVLPAQAVGKAVDAIIEALKQRNQDTTETIWEAVTYFAGLVFAFALVKGLFMYLMRQTLIVMSRNVEFDLKNEIFNHYQQLSPAFYRQHNTGDLMARISEDVGRVRMYIGPAVMYLMNLAITIITVVGAMYWVNPFLATMVLLPLPILSYAIFKVNTIINHRSDAIQTQLSVLTSMVQETFSGIRVVKSFATENATQQHFETETNTYYNRNMDLAKVDAMFFPLMLFLTGLSTLITIGVGGYLAIEGKVSVGNIAEFTIYVNMLVWPVTSLGWTTSLIQRAAVSQQRINDFLNTKPDITWPEGEVTFNRAITFSNVSYTYPGKTIPAIDSLSLTIPHGKTVAILGHTGSGKTTLLQLLLRLMDVDKGKIEVDGVPLQALNMEAFKSQIGYAPQEVFLFSDTIANNILFGLKQSERDEKQLMYEAAEGAALTQTIQDFPNGFETMVGERGITLSGGQKQRVAIARALIGNPQLVVLDDCLSALDVKTEEHILTHFRTFLKNRTAIIVSHRVSSVKDADLIVVLSNGKIIEQGTHESLLLMKGAYYGLFQAQIKPNVAEGGLLNY